MRIVAGALKGRRVAAPPGRIARPTSDRARETLFNALVSLMGSDVSRATVLDPFAGSGALGLEALSRGAAHATFAERDRKVRETLLANIQDLGVGERASVLGTDAFGLARLAPLPGAPFSLLLLDPPYRIGAAEVSALVGDLAQVGALTDDAVVTWEHDASVTPDLPEGFALHARKTLGSTALDILIRVRGVAST